MNMNYTRQVLINDGTLYHPEPVVAEWYGTRFTALGDSIVSTGNTMFDIMRDRLGFSSYRNAGVSGRPMAEGTANGTGTTSTARGLTYESDTMVYIAAGTNDFKLNAPLGEIGSVTATDHDDTTFFGAYRAALDHIFTSKPGIDVYLATPLQRDHAGYNTESVNTAGHKLTDYRNAVIEIGEMYSIPVVDMYTLSGISKRTLAHYTGDGLHPNATGFSRMARVAIAQIRTTA